MKYTAIIFLSLIFIQTDYVDAQLPLKYKLNKIEGRVYDKNNNPVDVRFISRQKLEIKNCRDSSLATFLQTLTLARHGRKELEYLLTRSGNVKIVISDKVGILYRDGKYRAIGGSSGPDDTLPMKMILDKSYNTTWNKIFNNKQYRYTYKNSMIEIFCGSLKYGNNPSMLLRAEDVKIIDWETNLEIRNFSMDTIEIEPISNPDMMYKNIRELFYFAGLHEIYHLRPENVKLQLTEKNAEPDAMELERKAFKKRTAINRRKIQKADSINKIPQSR